MSFLLFLAKDHFCVSHRQGTAVVKAHGLAPDSSLHQHQRRCLIRRTTSAAWGDSDSKVFLEFHCVYQPAPFGLFRALSAVVVAQVLAFDTPTLCEIFVKEDRRAIEP